MAARSPGVPRIAPAASVARGPRPREPRPPAPAGGLSTLAPSCPAHHQRSAPLVRARAIVAGVAVHGRVRASGHRRALAPHGLAAALGLEEPAPPAGASADRCGDPDPDSPDGAREPALGRHPHRWRVASVRDRGERLDRAYLPTAGSAPAAVPGLADLSAAPCAGDLGLRSVHRADADLPALHGRRRGPPPHSLAGAPARPGRT